METDSTTKRKPHVLILPFQEEGHFTVYLQLLYYLNNYDIRVTFCSSEARCQELTELQSKGEFQHVELHLKNIFSAPAANAGPEKEGDVPPLGKFCSAMEAEFKAYMSTLMDEKDPNAKPTFLLADLFLGWTEEIAEKLDIPRYVMFTCSAWAPWTCLWKQGANWAPDDFMTIPGMSAVRVKDAIPLVLDSLVSLKDAAGILCNSFQELEEGTIHAARSHLQKHLRNNGQVTKFLSIGPTLYLPGNPTFPDKKYTTRCLEWLDSNAPSSVLYVAFGTQAKLAAKTITEVALAIEASNVPFLWAFRLPHGVTELNSLLPPGFIARTKDRGHVETSFAPQRQILNHVSTGGFLSHCGWNSTIESICAGVPVVCYPLHGDQPLNSRVLLELTKTGIAISSSNDGRFDNISASIRSLMIEAKGQELRKTAASWKKVASASHENGGSSKLNVRQMVEDIFHSALRKEVQ